VVPHCGHDIFIISMIFSPHLLNWLMISTSRPANNVLKKK
jgi:hypothetical protein